jgi:hypothetical protein
MYYDLHDISCHQVSKDINLLQHLPLEERVAVRALVRDAVLATDMGRHAAIIQQV